MLPQHFGILQQEFRKLVLNFTGTYDTVTLMNPWQTLTNTVDQSQTNAGTAALLIVAAFFGVAYLMYRSGTARR